MSESLVMAYTQWWTGVYGPAGGITLLRKVDQDIQIVEEGGGTLLQSNIEAQGIPSKAAEEIVSEWGRGQ